MRKRMPRRLDKKLFRRTANRTKVANIPGRIVPRGGIRL